jgi:hypothetical protein
MEYFNRLASNSPLKIPSFSILHLSVPSESGSDVNLYFLQRSEQSFVHQDAIEMSERVSHSLEQDLSCRAVSLSVSKSLLPDCKSKDRNGPEGRDEVA